MVTMLLYYSFEGRWSFWGSWQKRSSGLACLLASYWQRRSQSEEPN